MLEMFNTMDENNYSIIVGEIERHSVSSMYGGGYEIAGTKKSSKVVFYDEQDALLFKLKFAEHISATHTTERSIW
jgi:hypothetical protein